MEKEVNTEEEDGAEFMRGRKAPSSKGKRTPSEVRKATKRGGCFPLRSQLSLVMFRDEYIHLSLKKLSPKIIQSNSKTKLSLPFYLMLNANIVHVFIALLMIYGHGS